MNSLPRRIANVLAAMSVVAEASAGPAMDSSGGNTKPGSRPPRMAGTPLFDEWYGMFERMCEVAEIALAREKGQDPFSGPMRAEDRNKRIIQVLKGQDPALAAYVAGVSDVQVRTLRRNAGLNKFGDEDEKAA